MTDNAARLRHYRNSLAISGAAVIVFGIWDIVKYFMLWIFGREDFEEQFGINTTDGAELAVFMFIFLILVAVDLWLRFVVFRNAVGVANGSDKRGIGWIIMAGVWLVLTIISVVTSFAALNDATILFKSLPTLIVDLTAIYALADLIRSALLVRRIESKSGSESGD